MIKFLKEVLHPPYFVHDTDLPGLDFNRDIYPPGKNENFPDGVIGIRVDGDFWSVAALPYEFLDVPLKEIVAELWPQYLEQASFKADSGSIEQKIEWYKDRSEIYVDLYNDTSKKLREAQLQLDRLRAERLELHERHPRRRKLMDSYFITQYEHLLIAMAHKEVPRKDAPGICEKCGLYGSDRVHMKKYIDKHNEGYEPHGPSLAGVRNEE